MCHIVVHHILINASCQVRRLAASNTLPAAATGTQPRDWGRLVSLHVARLKILFKGKRTERSPKFRICRAMVAFDPGGFLIPHSLGSRAAEQRALGAEAAECFANRNEFGLPSSPARGVGKAPLRWDGNVAPGHPPPQRLRVFGPQHRARKGRGFDAFRS